MNLGTGVPDPLFSNSLRKPSMWYRACDLVWYCAEAPMPTLTDTTLIVRCPYCLMGIEFRPMIAYKDGRFVCRDCAHTVRPGVPEYKCTCRPCLRVARGDDAEDGSLLLRDFFSKFS